MDPRRLSEIDSAASPQPPLSIPSHLLRDVSNLKTPRPYSKNPNPIPSSPSLQFFTASKKTPFPSSSTPTSSKSYSNFRHRNSTFIAPASRSKASRMLKALELEQSRSARKAHVRREKTLGSFARSLSAWINFLLRNPKACGCKINSCATDDQSASSSSNGKRGSLDGMAIDISGKWRSPKRQRGETNAGIDMNLFLMNASLLEKSLCNVCSLEDMLERMTSHMSRKCCNEVLSIMSQVCKNIDEGRLKMKLHCPLVTDLAVREKAVKILMCYNPLWLRIGLHILFGGDSLLLKHREQDEHFIKEFIEKHLLNHVGIARKYALNKLVGGIYRPGYYEALGNVILKRFLFLAIALDKAKCESSLPIKHGIDGIDGGSPLLFTCNSPIKSSRQIIQEFLMDSMHGEGDLLAHLVLLGCKVNYQQSPLCEYDFNVKNIFEDFRDGILLCRVVQLLLCNETILSKVRSPSNTPKKSLQNCSTAFQYLKDHGVQMSDSDGILVTATDLANGDNELTCSILWNVFVHLQVPLLINRTLLLEEIAKIKGSDTEFLKFNAISEMDLLLQWIQAVCATQNVKIYSFSSLVDGRALTSLIKYYFGNDIQHSFLQKENDDESNDDRINHFMCHSPALLDIAFIQNVSSKLGKSPQILPPCDIFDEDACIDERSIMILLAFHASQLISVDRLYMMDTLRFSQQVYQSPGPNPSSNSLLYLKGSSFRYPSLSGNLVQELHKKEGYTPEVSLPVFNSIALKEKSAIFIQARLRGFIKKKSFLKMKRSAILLQSVVKAWLALRYGNSSEYGTFTCSALCLPEIHGAFRQSANIEGSKTLDQQHRAAAKIQEAWKGYLHNMHSKRSCSAVKIQSQWRCWSIRKDFLSQVEAMKTIQSAFQSLIYHKAFHRKNIAAIEMQRFIRGHLVRTKLLGASKIRSSMIRQRSYGVINDSFMNNFELKILVHSVIKLQRWWKQVLLHRSRRRAAILIQSFVRGLIILRDAAMRKQAISTIQRWWRNILFFKKRKTSVLIIQAHLRGWISRQKFAQCMHDIVTIQSRWKGYLVRKFSRPQLLNLRHRMELSAANVNDEMRLINRLVVALTELLGYRSVSNIRQTCATLDRATELSQKCCETLVASGAIDILLKQIQLLNRGVPDQEVLKHVLSTLRNIVRYKHLSLNVINTSRSIEIIFQEILRNKNEGFLISCQLLRRLCTIQEGRETARKLQGHVKRLNNIIVELGRKAKFFERNAQLNNQKDLAARRLREAISLMTLIANDHFDG